ncbi:MAG: guanylate kinase [Gammaproteobacteria bacterium]|nr:guanylate kinase [Gammaproteobacteria bacterium]
MSQTSGNLYIIAAPSGGGKTSLVKALLKQDKNIEVSISHTSRSIRPGEENGVHYHFVTAEQFQQLKHHNEFVEFAEVFGNFYGTSKTTLNQQLNRGADVVLEIDWQGAQQIRQLFHDVCSIFILPPSREELLRRLRARSQDSEEVIARRTQEAVTEMSHFAEFDYLIFNDNFDLALSQLHAIFIARRQRLSQQQVMNQALINSLLA